MSGKKFSLNIAGTSIQNRLVYIEKFDKEKKNGITEIFTKYDFTEF